MSRPTNFDQLFTYHKPTGQQPQYYTRIREAGRAFAEELVACTPPGDDQAAALRKIREAVMTANAAIATTNHGGEG